MQYQVNINRKIFHLSGIFIPGIFFFQVFDWLPVNLFVDNTRSILFYLLASTSILLVVVECLRFKFPLFQKSFIAVVGPLLKKKEYDDINGSIGYMLGNTILLAFFPKEIAIISMLFLLFGDPLAAFIGSRYGKIPICHGRSLEGSVAGAVVGIFVASIFVALLTIFYEDMSVFYLWSENKVNFKILLMLLVGSLTAFTLEAISTRGLLDDNFLMPVGSAFIMLFVCQTQNMRVDFYPLHELIFPLAN